MSPSPKYRDKDDLGRPKPPFQHDASSNWRSATFRFRRKRRTIFYFLAICAIVYLLLHSRWWRSVLVADSDRPDQWLHDNSPSSSSSSLHRSGPPSRGSTSAGSKVQHTSKLTYNGPVRFVNLYETLYKVQQFHFRLRNPHVVFIAANMNSASILAGLACEMFAARRNVVHLVLVGRTEISLEFFKKANGMLQKDACSVVLHDARPDKASISTDDRMAISLKSAVRYIKDYIGPAVVITDADRESPWFRQAITEKTKESKISHIVLPHDVSTIPWLQKLDAMSLASWHKPTIDIVIHADAHSGQLVRLLKTLEKADYFTAPLPRLFIDLDPDTDKSVRDFINKYTWPSKEHLFVRHRIAPKSSLDDDPTTVVESFFPNSEDSAVLLLSPNTELSPFYFQYLFYAILEYKYSNGQSGLDKNLIYGISLDLPLSYLDGQPFDPSTLVSDEQPASPGTQKKAKPNNPFFYPVPSTHATLFFGSHWRILHLYLARRLNPAYTKGADYTLPAQVSKETPRWVAYFTELLAAGGYMMLYPNFTPTDSLAVYDGSDNGEKELMRANNILNLLPNGRLPLWSDLPVLALGGHKSTIAAALDSAQTYKTKILKSCGGVKKNDGEDDSVDDLFCSKADVVNERKKNVKEHIAAQAKQRKQGAEGVREQTAVEKLAAAEPSTEAPAPQPEKAPMAVNDDAVKPDALAANPIPQVIHNKIVSLDDLDTVPVDVGGEAIRVKGEA
ncbi:hypothetical protein DRE_00754 [Drechslerella stenobrocha 248]|uniref:Glycosyltransferase 2 n=1 Tax=Drechslerella stenobrocha 248 TaxID=1043628 RepID=W7I8J8_9PEZI|nr:hypothetical protein DRE_00754 [Drechslerella stenobrocha 248]